jgi:hypothetical protein
MRVEYNDRRADALAGSYPTEEETHMADLVRWDPFGEFARMDRTVNRTMTRAFSGFPRQALEPKQITVQ